MSVSTLKPGWRIVKFGEIADNINVRVDPAEAETTIYVGLEHLDPESLHLRRWGQPSDVIGDKLKFQKGDIIFGRRRAYQRKLAVAEFDGICSAHAMVVRAKPKVVLPEFLPFFMQSDMFMERAVEISVGSLSPTINWKTMAVQEFPLPPIEEQHRIAEILWAADEVVCGWGSCIDSLESVVESLILDTANTASEKGWPTKKLDEIALVERGKFSHRPRNLPQFYGGPYPFAQTGDIHRSNGYITEFEYTLTNEGKSFSKSFPPGSVLITIAAVIGATAITKTETWATDSVVGIVPKGDINVYFLEFYLRTKRHYLENVVATQTAQKNINLQALRPLEVPVPPLAVQRKIVAQVNRVQKQLLDVKSLICRTKSMTRGIFIG
ncbi:MAG: restriction endonuclease subunit S [Magnetococcales bacterium]|nr:restriction endonuclease subunit S [Magnetococcales bacterium]